MGVLAAQGGNFSGREMDCKREAQAPVAYTPAPAESVWKNRVYVPLASNLPRLRAWRRLRPSDTVTV